MNRRPDPSAGGVIRELELTGSAPDMPPETGGRLVYLLLRWQGRPVGRLVLEKGPVPDLETFHKSVLDAAAPGLSDMRRQEPAAGAASTDVAVVIATRNRAHELNATLDRITALHPAAGAVIVVDSASDDPAPVARAAARAGAQLVRLERAGLSRARNAGATAVSQPLVAFLDDDCHIDPGWLSGICAGFTSDAVHAVTGQLLPAELETAAQILFLRAFHMDQRGFVTRSFHAASTPSRHWPLDPWRMGSGGNLAVRRRIFLAGGGFRTDLGLGTPSRGGEDLFFLWDTIRGGAQVVYRPDAMAWHRHHRNLDQLGRVMFGYGAGHAAFLRAARLAGAPRGRVALATLSWLASRMVRLTGSVGGRGPLPPAMVLRELAGGAAGPVLARRAQAAS